MTYYSDKPVEDKSHGGIVGTVEEGRHTIFLPAIKPLLQMTQPGGIQSTNRLKYNSTL